MTHSDHLSGERRASAAPVLVLGMPPEKFAAWVLRGMGALISVLLLVVGWGINANLQQIDRRLLALESRIGELSRAVELEARDSIRIEQVTLRHGDRLTWVEDRVGKIENRIGHP